MNIPVNNAPSTNVTVEVPVVVVEVTDTDRPFAAVGYYENCDAVRAANAAPIYANEPGYRIGLDRDRDGIGCEVAGDDDRAVTTSYNTKELAYTGTGDDAKIAGGIGAALLALGAGVIFAGRGRHRKTA
ncbi:hypothetical protein GM708_14455 [Vibrio cholerae]|nr:hypothetical protein [Vibrio cholerae]